MAGKTKTKVERPSLEEVYLEIETLLRRHAPPFRTDIGSKSGSKRAFQLTVPKPVAIPGAYGGKPTDLMMAAVILQKGYVGFYLMCLYLNDRVKKGLSPRLLKSLKGKTCFQIKEWDVDLKKAVATALTQSEKLYRQNGWV